MRKPSQHLSARRDFADRLPPEVSQIERFVEDVLALAFVPLAGAALIVFAWAVVLHLFESV